MQDQGTRASRHVLIPAEVLDLLRDGLRGRLAVAAQRISDADERLDAREHPERYQDPLRCIDALRALLDDIGWITPPGASPAEPRVDLQVHGLALTEALREQVSVYADMLRDIDPAAARRATVARDLNALSSLALTILLGAHAGDLRGATPRGESE
jgi:hypothetical protein